MEPVLVLEHVVLSLLPAVLQRGEGMATQRRGIIGFLRHLLDTLPMACVPFVAFFVAPLLAGMNDVAGDVRTHAALGFAATMALIPLEPDVRALDVWLVGVGRGGFV